ncbi:DNA topoisomerase 2 [Elasticomyces elasticus]|nr:DNA topoisomerase 2 [Elasticomyces elasticus]
MVKGIGGSSADDSRQLFSERSRPGSSGSTGSKAIAKSTSKLSTDFDADETDYSKLVPQNSPRRTLQVKSKEAKADDDEGDGAKPAAKGKSAAAAKAKAAPAKPRGRAAAAAAKTPAAKQAKGKKIADDMSDDDIDTMANDILDSPAGKDGSEADERQPARQAASRPSRRTAATKKSYAIEDDEDSEDDLAGGGDSDDFEEDDDSE